MSKKLTILNHPLIDHKLTIARDKNTEREMFAKSISSISSLMVYESTKSLKLRDKKISTPIEDMVGKEVANKTLIVPILRAGLSMSLSFVKFLPNVTIAHLGIKRNEETLEPIEYYSRVPNDISGYDIFLVDPMLATAGSAIAALNLLKKKGAKNIICNFIIAAPEGIKKLQKAHPDVTIIVACLDKKLNNKGYICPGLGDAGDRYFGTN